VRLEHSGGQLSPPPPPCCLSRIIRDLAQLARAPQLINEAVGMAIARQQYHRHKKRPAGTL
jgi:hypothetical protein